MSPLKQKILSLIRANGPISVGDYMTLALYDSEHGYYTTRDPLGVRGDFTTAPEVSQLFGEMIGAFLVRAWLDRRSPKPFHLIELGPGRGTLMADILRAARVRPEFVEAAQITLVETSPKLREAQKEVLAGFRVQWADALDQVPGAAPLFVVANEFFDALPVRQFVMAKDGWHERMITADGDTLAFALAPDKTALDVQGAPEGAIFEVSPASRAIATMIAERVVADGGLALIVDYGHARAGFGDTFQAVKAHKPADPLAEPGEADLTAHADFAALVEAASAAGARSFGPVSQKAFLESLGIQARAHALSRAHAEHAADIASAVARLTGAQEMGELFKVLVISNTPAPPAGFPLP